MKTIGGETRDILQNGNGSGHEPVPSANGASMKYDTAVEVLLIIRQYWRRMLISALLAFAVCFLALHFFHIRYYSRVTFITETAMPEGVSYTEPEMLILTQMNTLNRRMQQFIYSDDMVKRLDAQIQIGKHYGFSPDDESYYDKIASRLEHNVTFSKNNIIATIEAGDKDKHFAPLLANTIYSNLEKMNKEIVYNVIRYKLSLYTINMEQYNARKMSDAQEFQRVLNGLLPEGNSGVRKPENIYDLKQDLSNLFIEYSNNNNELLKNEMIYKITSNAAADTTLKSMYLLRKAGTSSLTNAYLLALLYSTGVSVCIGAYVFFAIYFSGKFRNYLGILYRKELPAIHKHPVQ